MSIPIDLDFNKRMSSIGVEDRKRVVQEPINGPEYTFSNTGPRIPIYGNKPGWFSNNTDMIIRADVYNSNATAACTFTFEGRVGTGGVIKNMYLTSAGDTPITNLKASNVLYPILVQKQASPDWYENNGKKLYAHESTPLTNADGTMLIGDATNITAGTNSKTNLLPLCMSSFFEQKYWSLEGQTVYLSMDLESSIIACMAGNAACTATDLVLKLSLIHI